MVQNETARAGLNRDDMFILTENTTMDMAGISDDVCFGTFEQLSQYKEERKSKHKITPPLVKPMSRTSVTAVGLPRKKDPWYNKKDFISTKTPTNVSLPRSKMPWDK